MTIQPNPLTSEQRQVVEAEITSRVVVLAAAGTGKTEVVARRLSWLCSSAGLSPSAVLILSFSNAAVSALKSRVHSEGAVVAGFPIATIDSYASRLLAVHEPYGDWHEESYAGRIRSATRLVEHDEEIAAIVREFRHVVVDEVQDLVGDRAEFVDRMLQRLSPDAGMTLLGDPAQGVYDWTLDESTSKLTSRQFLTRVLERQPKPHVAELTKNFRAKTALAARVADSGHAVRAWALGRTGTPTAGSIASELDRLHPFELPRAAMIIRTATADHGSAAVLCRYGCQALTVSRGLDAAGIPHRLHGDASDAWIGAWLARTMSGYQYPTIAKADFLDRLVADASLDAEPERAWKALKRAEGRSTPELSLRVLVSRLRTRRLPVELVEPPSSQVSVSTIHRAKGLEWDVVFLCGVESADLEGPDDLRVAYVGMTRAREELYLLPEPESRGLRRRRGQDNRWVRSGARGRLRQLEVLSDDVEWAIPAGAAHIDARPSEIQKYLSSSVAVGDPVKLRLRRSVVDGTARAVYSLDHNGRQIGVTSEGFSQAIAEGQRAAGGDPFPVTLTGLRVAGIETVGGSSAESTRNGLGASGLWLRPRVYGLADVQWGDEK